MVASEAELSGLSVLSVFLVLMKSFRIRIAEKNDNIRLALIIKSVFEEFGAPKTGTVYSDPTTNNLFEFFQKDRSVLWVAEDEKEVVGLCGIYPTEGLEESCGELVKFYLLSWARGKRIGKALFEKSMLSATELGYKKIYIESLPQFVTAVKMYEKAGFTKLNHSLGNSGHTTCNIWMTKVI